MNLIIAAFNAVQGDDGTFLTPFETFLVDLLLIPANGKRPTPDQVEPLLVKFRQNSERLTCLLGGGA